jgi:hypothetical protein
MHGKSMHVRSGRALFFHSRSQPLLCLLIGSGATLGLCSDRSHRRRPSLKFERDCARGKGTTYARLKWGNESFTLRLKSPALLLYTINLPFDVYQSSDRDKQTIVRIQIESCGHDESLSSDTQLGHQGADSDGGRLGWHRHLDGASKGGYMWRVLGSKV